MQVSAEIRWFWRLDALPELAEWFCGARRHAWPLETFEERTDDYLFLPSQPELGIKRRDRKGLEIKGLVGRSPEALSCGPFTGPVELWTKWPAADLDATSHSQIVSASKRRWMRKFDTSGPSVREARIDPGKPLPAPGCNVELTMLTSPQGETWWTFCLESFGTIYDVEGSLRATAAELARRDPPPLPRVIVANYPQWFAQRACDAAISIRLATPDDVPALNDLIAASVRKLQATDYTEGQREGALGSVFGVDPVLIEDRTYFVAAAGNELRACGGWSRRATPFGTDHSPARDDSVLDPARDAAKIRALFVHPEHARGGLGTRILNACEAAAKAAGFHRTELTATMTGIKLFGKRGYTPAEEIQVRLRNGELLPVIRMVKQLV
jgi:GNAT superfamily N-acetyltransferase